MGECKDFISDLRVGETLCQQAEESSKYCDVTIVYGPPGDMKMIWAHWCVLVQCPYFEAMYRCGLQEKQQGKIFISESLPKEAVSAVIRFLYTGKVNCGYHLILEVLNAADYFQFDDLIDFCRKYLSTIQLTKENCVEVLQMARRYHFEDIQNRSMAYMTNNLLEVIGLPANGKNITGMMVTEIGNRAISERKCQMKLCQFYQTWLEYDEHNRKETFEKLFCSLNLNDTTHAFFQSLSCDNIQTFKQCRKYYAQVNRQNFQNGLAFSVDTVGVVLLVAKIPHIQNSRGIYAYAIGSDRWSFLTRLPRELRENDYYSGRYCIGFNPLGKSIYVTKGEDVYLNRNSTVLEIPTFKYDSELNRWSLVTFTLSVKELRQICIKTIYCANNQIVFIVENEMRKRRHKSVRLLACSEQTTLEEVTVIPNISYRWTCPDVKSCLVGERYIVVMSSEENLVDKFIKISVTDIHGLRTSRCKTIKEMLRDDISIFGTEDVMYTSGEGVIISSFGSAYHREVSISPPQCCIVDGVVLPNYDDDGEGLQLQDRMIGNGENAVSIYNKSTQRLRVFYCITNEQYVSPPFPYDIQDCTLVHANLPARLLKCRIDCPHCLFEIKSGL